MSRSTTAPPVVLEVYMRMDRQNNVACIRSDDAEVSSFICSHESLMVYHGYLIL